MALVSERIFTAPIAAFGLIAGFGAAVASGSRPLGGLVLAVSGATCVVVWLRRDGRRVTALLTFSGLVAFAISHVLGRVIGAWPSVIVVAAACGALCWRLSDAPAQRRVSGGRSRSRSSSVAQHTRRAGQAEC